MMLPGVAGRCGMSVRRSAGIVLEIDFELQNEPSCGQCHAREPLTLDYLPVIFCAHSSLIRYFEYELTEHNDFDLLFRECQHQLKAG
jgi:hypothetical protein